MMAHVNKALDNGECVIVIFLDFSKPFDNANHSILIDKLYHYGITGMLWSGFVATCQIEANLCHTMVFVLARNRWHVVYPKGLYLVLYYFPFTLWLLQCMSRLCAHIICWWYHNFYQSNKMEYIIKINNGELHISLWLKINRLSLNIKKTHFMMLQTRNSTISIPDVTIDNQPFLVLLLILNAYFLCSVTIY